MYGPVFASMFTGSMYGAGPVVFSVWTYAIACCGKDGRLDINPQMLAGIIGCGADEVEEALEFLGKTDENSRSSKQDGVRLEREGQFQYLVVNYEDYQKMLAAQKKLDYDRDYQQKKRDQKSPPKKETTRKKKTHVKPDAEFEMFWDIYPRKIQKAAALKRWSSLDSEKKKLALEAISEHAIVWQAQGRDMAVIPHASTWLNQERWEDDLSGELQNGKNIPSNNAPGVESRAANYDRF